MTVWGAGAGSGTGSGAGAGAGAGAAAYAAVSLPPESLSESELLSAGGVAW